MRLAIMQPYFFPYIGYFQLVHAVDTFVIFDDVNYIKRGWINRNRIWNQGEPLRITLSVRGASINKLINQISVGDNRQELLKTIQRSYSKAPFYPETIPLLEPLLMNPESELSGYLSNSLREVSSSLGMHPEWILSSDIPKDNSLRGKDKVLAICNALGASEYINLPGGRSLYDKDAFSDRSMKLEFIKPDVGEYTQFGPEFIPNLSIIDVLMFNGIQGTRELLREYTLAVE